MPLRAEEACYGKVGRVAEGVRLPKEREKRSRSGVRPHVRTRWLTFGWAESTGSASKRPECRFAAMRELDGA